MALGCSDQLLRRYLIFLRVEGVSGMSGEITLLTMKKG